MRRVVTAIAGQACVLAFEGVPGFGVIERPNIPFDELKVGAIVLGVAGDAAIARARLDAVGGVQAAMRIEPRGDFAVTLQALEGCLTRGKLMAADAVHRAAQ